MRTWIPIIFLLCLPVSAWANMANPLVEGDVTSQLGGSVSDLAVEKERLEFDLRTFPDEGFATVRATYHIDNDGSPQQQELQFVAVGLADNSTTTVTLDSKPLEIRIDEAAEVPRRWMVSANHFMQGEAGMSRDEDVVEAASIFFNPTIPSGESRIVVTYDVVPWTNAPIGVESPFSTTIHRHNDYTIPYVLEPAREWGSFGAIEVDVKAPDNWRVKTNPALARGTSGLLKGSDEALPKRVFYVHMRPEFFYDKETIAGFVVGVLIVILMVPGFAIGFPLLRRRLFGPDEGEEEGCWVGIIDSLAAGAIAAAGPWVGVLTFYSIASSEHVHPSASYGTFFLLAMLAPLSGLLAVAMVAVGFRTRRASATEAATDL